MKNDLAGVWRMRDLKADAGTEDCYGAAADGLLTFTEDLQFSVAVVRSDLPHVSSGDRMDATDDELWEIARGTIGLYGTYRVDDDGAFVDQHVVGSTNASLWGRDLGDDAVTIGVEGGELTLASKVAAFPVGHTTWERVGPAGATTSSNKIVGAWRMESAKAVIGDGGQEVEPFGAAPSGSLIFAEGLYFTDILHRSDLKPLAGGDPTKATDEENRSTVEGSLIVFGSYTVDADGEFQDEVVVGSSMPNWKGMSRDTTSLTETVRDDRMFEHLDDGDGVVIDIAFSRVPAA